MFRYYDKIIIVRAGWTEWG